MTASRFSLLSTAGAVMALGSFATAQTNIITFDSAIPTDGFFEAADPANGGIVIPTEDGLEFFIPSFVGTGASFGGGPETNFAIAAFGNTSIPGADGTPIAAPFGIQNSPELFPAVPGEGEDALEVVVRVLEGNESDIFNINVFEQAITDAGDVEGELDGNDFIRIFTYEFDITGVGDEFVALQVPLDGFQTDFVGGFNLFGDFFGVGEPEFQVPNFTEGTGQIEIQSDFFNTAALGIEVQSVSFVAGDVVVDVQEGDFAGADGIVDQADLDAVLLNFGTDIDFEGVPAEFDNPDFQPVGVIGQEELDAVLLNFGAGVGGAAAVPEPASAALLALGGVAMMRRRK